MITCAECGTSNEPHSGACRACGRSLTRDGAKRVVASGVRNSAAPARNLSTVEAMAEPSQSPSRDDEPPSPSREVGMNRRGQEPPSARGFATRQPRGLTSDARRPSSEPPLPPLPDGGLAASMPAWLRDSGPPMARPTEQPSGLPVPDPTDTTTFLSEDDLPEWLRRLPTTLADDDAEFPRESSPQTVPPPRRVNIPPPQAASNPAGPGEMPGSLEIAPPTDPRPDEDPTTPPLPSGEVVEPVERFTSASEAQADTLAPDAEETPASAPAQRVPTPPDWRRLLLALFVAVAVVALVYLVTSGRL